LIDELVATSAVALPHHALFATPVNAVIRGRGGAAFGEFLATVFWLAAGTLRLFSSVIQKAGEILSFETFIAVEIVRVSHWTAPETS
jgi:hypothetical protein